MRPNDYQAACLRTWYDGDDDKDDQLANASLGLAGETGEVVDLVKKMVFHGHVLDLEDLESELGDVLYYAAVLSSIIGLELEHVLETNIEKLRKRYPDGFSEERSRKRDDRANKVCMVCGRKGVGSISDCFCGAPLVEQ